MEDVIQFVLYYVIELAFLKRKFMASSFVYNQPAPSMPDVSYSNYLSQGEGRGFANFVGGLFGGYKNWADSQLAQYQNSFNQWQQNYTNAYNEFYNSPSHQAELYEDAGFNKNLIASQSTGSSSNSMSPISAQVPNVTDVGKGPFSAIGSIFSLANAVLGIKNASIANKKSKESLVGLGLENERKGIENEILRETYDDIVSSKKFSSWNSFNKYQRGLQELHKNDFLIGTNFAPQSDLSSFKISDSPFGKRYSAETEGIQALTGLREMTSFLTRMKGKEQEYFNRNIQPLILRIQQGKATEQEVNASFAEIEKEFGMGSRTASLLISLLKNAL